MDKILVYHETLVYWGSWIKLSVVHLYNSPLSEVDNEVSGSISSSYAKNRLVK